MMKKELKKHFFIIFLSVFKDVLNCSYATLCNDLVYLEKKGMVLRTHGGAVRTDVLPAFERTDIIDTNGARYVLEYLRVLRIRDIDIVITVRDMFMWNRGQQTDINLAALCEPAEKGKNMGMCFDIESVSGVHTEQNLNAG